MDNHVPFNELPTSWQRKIQGLRAECADGRVELREVRAELAALKAQISK